jgi:hypothetical protein
MKLPFEPGPPRTHPNPSALPATLQTFAQEVSLTSSEAHSMKFRAQQYCALLHVVRGF